MRAGFWLIATGYQNILNNGFHKLFKRVSILVTFTPNPELMCNIKSYSLLLTKDFQSSQLYESNIRHKSEFLNKSEYKRMVSEKKKYNLKRNTEGDEKSSYAENRSNELPQNKLEKISPKISKTKNDMKKFKVKDVIYDHDLQIKIDSMLKYVEKGKKVFCEVVAISTVKGKNQINEVLKKLNNSKLKNYVLDTQVTPNRLFITYFQKDTKIGSDKVKEKETNKPS